MTGDLIARASCDLAREGKLKKVYTGADTVDFKMSNLPDILRERVHEYFCDPIKGCIDKKPVPGVYWMVALLESIGHEVGVLTSRPAPLHEATHYILLRDFPDVHFHGGIHFANQGETCNLKDAPSKEEIIRQLKPDFYFDDYYDYCMQAVKAGVPNVFLVKNKHTGWNKRVEVDKRVTPIRNVAFFEERLVWESRRDRITRRRIR